MTLILHSLLPPQQVAVTAGQEISFDLSLIFDDDDLSIGINDPNQ